MWQCQTAKCVLAGGQTEVPKVTGIEPGILLVKPAYVNPFRLPFRPTQGDSYRQTCNRQRCSPFLRARPTASMLQVSVSCQIRGLFIQIHFLSFAKLPTLEARNSFTNVHYYELVEASKCSLHRLSRVLIRVTPPRSLVYTLNSGLGST